MGSREDSSRKDGVVVDLSSFRKKKEVEGEFARGRKPLYMSHLEGRVTGSPHLKRPEAQDFGDRLQRIRTSLEKINKLMTELRRMSQSKDAAEDREANASKIQK